MSPLVKYTALSVSCVKCDGTHAGTVYDLRWDPDKKESYGIMVRSCSRCHYQWDELPLDSKEE